MINAKNTLQSKKFKYLMFRENTIIAPIIGLLFLVILLTILSPEFLKVSNILNILKQVSAIGIVSAGMTYVILTGGIDLSVGSIVALSGVITGVLMKNLGLNMALSIFIGIISGGLCGLVNGIMVTSKVKMAPFIATLCMMSIAKGLALVITSGQPIFGLPKSFSYIGGAFFLKIPIAVLIMIVIFATGYVCLKFTKLGLNIYAVGGNERATRLAGINTNRLILLTYIISGLTAGIGGIVLSSRVMVSEPIAGSLYELDAITAVVIGGVSMLGGEGSIIGTFLGVLVIGILRNGLNILGVSTYLQQVLVGLVLGGTVAFNMLKRK